jgi:glutathione S-transferase
MNAITLWGRRSAFNVQKVLWLLDELGLEFHHRQVGGQFGGLDTPTFGAMNPHRRVPVLEDGSTVVWESHAILRYLAARYGANELWPADPATRSLADRWMDWSQCSLQPPFMRLFWGYFRTPPERRKQVLLETALAECDRLFAVLNEHLKSQRFLAGPTFSLADIPAGTTLYRYFEMGIEVPRHSHVDAWYGRLSERPAYRGTIMVSFEELRGRLEF